MTHLFSDAGEDYQEGQEDGEEYDVECERLHIACDGCAVAVGVQRRASVIPEGVEPALHGRHSRAL